MVLRPPACEEPMLMWELERCRSDRISLFDVLPVVDVSFVIMLLSLFMLLMRIPVKYLKKV